MTRRPTLLSFGHGYSATALGRRLLEQGWHVIGTTRSHDRAASLGHEGVEAVIWPPADPAGLIKRATHVLSSAGPDEAGDPVLAVCDAELRAHAPRLAWAGYLSTTGVYGDRRGDWVDETEPCRPTTRRGKWRVAAEQAWSDIPGLPLHIFRLAGIYGPGRGPFSKVRAGTARRIVKPGQVFSRIHVDDIANVLAASIDRPGKGPYPEIYNVCDDDPAPPQDVIALAADLLGVPRPPEIAFEEAELSPMARSFYAESKRVRNDRLKRDLGVDLTFPSYRDGLPALLAIEED